MIDNLLQRITAKKNANCHNIALLSYGERLICIHGFKIY